MPEIKQGSITEAWRNAACMAAQNHRRVTGLTVVIDNIKDGHAIEDFEFRDRFNQILEKHEMATVETVSRTIFPSGLWNPNGTRADLYKRYLSILPKLRGWN